MKKFSASYRQEKPTKQNKLTTLNTNISAKTKNELKKLVALSDDGIDYSDISPLDFNSLGKPAVGRFYRPIKKQISIRLDTDILDWFKHAAKQYQALINRACREYMEHYKKADQGKKIKKIESAFGLYKAKHSVSLADMDQAIRKRGGKAHIK